MARTRRGTQLNNRAPMGQGQPQQGRQSPEQELDPSVLLGPIQDPTSGTMPVGQPQQYQPPDGSGSPLQPPPPQVRGPIGTSIGMPQQQQQQPNVPMQGPDLGSAILGRQVDFSQPRGTGDLSRVGGLDPRNVGNMQSAKYRALEYLSGWDPTPENLRAAVASEQFQRMFPGAQVSGKSGDLIDFGQLVDPHSGVNLGLVDVGGAFDPTNNTGSNWWWHDLQNSPSPGNDIYKQYQQQLTQQPLMEQSILGNVPQESGMGEDGLLQLLQALLAQQEQY